VQYLGMILMRAKDGRTHGAVVDEDGSDFAEGYYSTPSLL